MAEMSESQQNKKAGRPRKYSSDTDKIKAKKRQTLASYHRNKDHNQYYCEVCDNTYHINTKSRHLKSKIHLKLQQRFSKLNL
jgi:hypothetical protein